jgi:hypothetical protein
VLQARAYPPPPRAGSEPARRCHTCRNSRGSRRIARLNPVAAEEARLFSVILQGQHLLNGFRNRDVTQALSPTPPKCPVEAQRRWERTSHLLAKLRGQLPRSLRTPRKFSNRNSITPTWTICPGLAAHRREAEAGLGRGVEADAVRSNSVSSS